MVLGQGLSVSEVCRSVELGETTVRRWVSPTLSTGRSNVGFYGDLFVKPFLIR
jgi:hypothetical protein